MYKKLIKRFLRSTGSSLLTLGDSVRSEQTNAPKILDEFLACCRNIDSPRVLELGTKRSIPDRPTKHNQWVPHASEFLGVDISEGIDVDIVADVHRLSEVVKKNLLMLLFQLRLLNT